MPAQRDPVTRRRKGPELACTCFLDSWRLYLYGPTKSWRKLLVTQRPIPMLEEGRVQQIVRSICTSLQKHGQLSAESCDEEIEDRNATKGESIFQTTPTDVVKLDVTTPSPKQK